MEVFYVLLTLGLFVAFVIAAGWGVVYVLYVLWWRVFGDRRNSAE